MKFDPAGPYTIRGGHMPAMADIARTVDFCRAVHEAAGDRAKRLFGTHEQFSTARVIRVAKVLEPFGSMCFEEPVPPDNAAEMAKAARATSITLAADERLSTKAPICGPPARQCRHHPAAGAGPLRRHPRGEEDPSPRRGGEGQLAPHLYAGPMEWAANIQLAANMPNLRIMETIGTGGAFHQQQIGHAIRWEEGFIRAPDAPASKSLLTGSPRGPIRTPAPVCTWRCRTPRAGTPNRMCSAVVPRRTRTNGLGNE